MTQGYRRRRVHDEVNALRIVNTIASVVGGDQVELADFYDSAPTVQDAQRINALKGRHNDFYEKDLTRNGLRSRTR